VKTIEEKVAVHRAWLEGKQIQVVNRQKTVWNDTDAPLWDWLTCKYRVKPEPAKPAVAKAYVHTNGAVYWTLDRPIMSRHYTRTPEFDIVAKLPDSSK
jgi:hypothetical protein